MFPGPGISAVYETIIGILGGKYLIFTNWCSFWATTNWKLFVQISSPSKAWPIGTSGSGALSRDFPACDAKGGKGRWTEGDKHEQAVTKGRSSDMKRGLNEVISLLCLNPCIDAELSYTWIWVCILEHRYSFTWRRLWRSCTHWSAASSAFFPLRYPFFTQIAPGLLLHISSLWCTASKLFLIKPSRTDYCRTQQVIGTKLRDTLPGYGNHRDFKLHSLKKCFSLNQMYKECNEKTLIWKSQRK